MTFLLDARAVYLLMATLNSMFKSKIFITERYL